MLHDEVKAIDLIAARSELQKAVNTINAVSNENTILKNSIASTQDEFQKLVTKVDAANNLVNRLQANLARTVCTASGAEVLGQASFNSDSKEAQEFAKNLVDNHATTTTCRVRP
jgi:hypothetical protein